MKLRLPFLLAAVVATLAGAAHAALKPGDVAPDFTTRAALGGKAMDFKLADALKKGPVVLYFFPKSFTQGCTAEAHLFAEATDRFAALGATVVGISHDDIATQVKFSQEACRNKFAVGADPDSRIIKAYDAKLAMLPMSDRISYVIAPDGKVIYEYQSLDPQNHVANTMKAVQDWKAAHR
ncbi:MAG TPA: peroxiredoxin [Burkholderiaceae bacterium]